MAINNSNIDELMSIIRLIIPYECSNIKSIRDFLSVNLLQGILNYTGEQEIAELTSDDITIIARSMISVPGFMDEFGEDGLFDGFNKQISTKIVPRLLDIFQKVKKQDIKSYIEKKSKNRLIQAWNTGSWNTGSSDKSDDE